MIRQIKLSEAVRNWSYGKTKIETQIDRQRAIIEKVLLEYPEGITDREISQLTGISISSINGRRTEIKNVKPISIARIVFTDERDRFNIMWGIKND
jgi:hypothetical protein